MRREPRRRRRSVWLTDRHIVSTWSDSTADWAFGIRQLELLDANSEAQSQNGPPKTNPEYVLGGIDQPLAIALAAFTAMVAEDCIEIFMGNRHGSRHRGIPDLAQRSKKWSIYTGVRQFYGVKISHRIKRCGIFFY